MSIMLTAYADDFDLTIEQALLKAEAEGLQINTYASPIDSAREGISVDEAIDVARIDPSLVYLTGSSRSA